MRALVVWAMVLVVGFSVNAAQLELVGAGATFPYPLYSKMFEVYHKEYGVAVNYQAIGSGGGIEQLANKTVDFGASDAFMSDEELKKAPGVVHIPICLGAVVLTYNLPQNPQVRLTPEVISDIYLGKITKWNDKRLQQINPQIKLPALNIAVIHRSDGSGTTYVFADYLAQNSKEWLAKVGRGKSLNWPAGMGAKGNAGVAGLVKQIPGGIGYAELVYTLQNKMPAAVIKNRAGNFVKAALETVTDAAQVKLPEDMRISLTDSEVASAYPISGFTWILLYQEQKYGPRTKEKATALVNMLDWMTHQGQKYAGALGYAPLSKQAVKQAEKIINSITYENNLLKK